jgi:hypothetical protein
MEHTMKKTNTRTFLLTVAPHGNDAPAPTASDVDRAIWPHLPGTLLTIVDYQVPAAGKMAFEFNLGQRICNRRDGKIGRIEGFEFDSEKQLIAHVLLESPYVSPAWTARDGTVFQSYESWRYLWPAWELQAISEAPVVEQEQREIAEACATWFERQA